MEEEALRRDRPQAEGEHDRGVGVEHRLLRRDQRHLMVRRRVVVREYGQRHGGGEREGQEDLFDGFHGQGVLPHIPSMRQTPLPSRMK
jgi:hypothetical protein